MNIAIDVILILIVASFTYRGYKKGIIDVGFKIFAMILSVVITIVLYSPITNLIINNTEIDEKIENVIIENGITKDEDSNPESNNSVLESFIQNYSKGMVKSAQNSLIESAAKPIAKNVVGIIVLIVLFLLVRCTLEVIKLFTDIIKNIPFLKQCNEFAGLIYGLIQGIIIIYLLLAITFFVLSLSGDTSINELLEQTYITKFFYNNNIILKLLF